MEDSSSSSSSTYLDGPIIMKSSKGSTDTFGLYAPDRVSSPSTPTPRTSTLPLSKSDSLQSSTVAGNLDNLSDSDEVPYSDSDTEPERNGSSNNLRGETTIVKTNGGIKHVDQFEPSTNEVFPKPPIRKGSAVIKQNDLPLSTDQKQQQQQHTVGGLAHTKSTTSNKIHRKQLPPAPILDAADLQNGENDDAFSFSSRSVYRRAGLRSDLAEWAPSAKPPVGAWAGITNLPDWNTLRVGDPTSKPIVQVQRDLDWSMRRLLDEKVFEQLLHDQLGRHRFREFLANNTGTENKLDMYFDLCQYVKQSDAIRQASEALHDIYLAQDSEGHVKLSEEMSDDFYTLLKRQFEVKASSSLGPIQQHLLQSMYKGEFQIFIKARLIEYNKVKLGSFNNDDDDDNQQTGLGDCYCLTNPRLRENPIVLVSPGFEKVTGYPRQQIIGRNCRFLQGPGTAPDSVQRIRDALNAGEPCTELLLNYCRDGTPFFCLLTIIPLRDATGALVYHIGGQTNVNGQLANSKGLRFLLGGGVEGSSGMLGPQGSTINGLEVSPSLARYIQSGANVDVSTTTEGTSASLSSFKSNNNNNSIRELPNKRGFAAGAYDPQSQNGPFQQSLHLGPNKENGFHSKPLMTRGSAMSRIFGKSTKKDRLDPYSLVESSSQRLMGAEGAMRKESYSLEDQMQYFTSLYSRIIIFKRTKREIIFATRECIAFFELPIDTWKDVYASPLIHADLLSVLQGSDKEETRAVQHSIQAAVRNGESISVKTGIKQVRLKKRFLGAGASTPDWISTKMTPKYTTIHITPLYDRHNSSFAFVAIFA